LSGQTGCLFQSGAKPIAERLEQLGESRDRPIHASVASCSTPSRRGLASPMRAEPAVQRPALTASRHEANGKSWVGTKKRAFRIEQRNSPLLLAVSQRHHSLPVSLFDLKAVSSSRPAEAMTPRADARQGWPSHGGRRTLRARQATP